MNVFLCTYDLFFDMFKIVMFYSNFDSRSTFINYIGKPIPICNITIEFICYF